MAVGAIDVSEVLNSIGADAKVLQYDLKREQLNFFSHWHTSDMLESAHKRWSIVVQLYRRLNELAHDPDYPYWNEARKLAISLHEIIRGRIISTSNGYECIAHKEEFPKLFIMMNQLLLGVSSLLNKGAAAKAEEKVNKVVKLAIISDIHSNLDALNAVLEDIRRSGIRHILCCGDIVGYGPEPKECISKLQGLNIKTVIGNHDVACATNNMFDSNEIAIESAQWTIGILAGQPAYLKYLRNLPIKLSFDFNGIGISLFHGYPLEKEDHNCYLSYIVNKTMAGFAFEQRRLFKRTPVVFIGHTHSPIAFIEEKEGANPKVTDLAKPLKVYPKRHRYIINAGSVGQPRDRNNKACYLVFSAISPDEAEVEMVRVGYDIGATIRKIKEQQVYATERFGYLACSRLREGR